MLTDGNLTHGAIGSTLIRFTLPMIAGALLQQCYNIADTLIVGRCIGTEALAAVGSAYTLTVFLLSILQGLSLGSGTVFSLHFGAGQHTELRRSIFTAFLLTGTATVLLNIAVLANLRPLLRLLQVPQEIFEMMTDYLRIVCLGIPFAFIYNFYAALLRAVGDAVTPLRMLSLSVVLNILLDLVFILLLDLGTTGAAFATLLAQAAAAATIVAHTHAKYPGLLPQRADRRIERRYVREIVSFSALTCVQQSVMNFGILLVQGLVNSFGTAVMAAFAAAVKIDSFAYMPVQEFGNAFSTFVAQNFGAGHHDRIRKGMHKAFLLAAGFSAAISVAAVLFARPLLRIFILPERTEILRIGVEYLRIEGAFYIGIGMLFLWYGYFRAIRRPGMSVVLTIVSLGVRVVLAYRLAAIPTIGVTGIWWSVPIGWLLADLTGWVFYRRRRSLPQR